VTVLRQGGLHALGIRHHDVVAYNWGWTQDGVQQVQRTFVLLDDGIQISQPVLFPSAQRGWWYCDLVQVADEGDLVRVDDLWIDVVVGPPDHPYRVLDLDEYGQALAAGDLGVADAADGLARLQRFLDRRLNRRHDVEQRWVDFPPAAVQDLLTLDLPHEWSMGGT
jgi:hypothetical protein